MKWEKRPSLLGIKKGVENEKENKKLCKQTGVGRGLTENSQDLTFSFITFRKIDIYIGEII